MSLAQRTPLAVRLLVQAAVWLVALSMLAPFAWMVITSLKTDAEATRAPTLATVPPTSLSAFQWSRMTPGPASSSSNDVTTSSVEPGVAKGGRMAVRASIRPYPYT